LYTRARSIPITASAAAPGAGGDGLAGEIDVDADGLGCPAPGSADEANAGGYVGDRADGSTADECGETGYLLPGGDERRGEAVVFSCEEFDFSLELGEPGFFALSAFERR
jgi:hypothetical protein